MPLADWRAKLERHREIAYPAAAALCALLLIFPFIGGYGLWDPQEFVVADMAREVAHTGDYASVYATRPPLTVWASAVSIGLFGASELAVRLPHALFALIAVLATYGAGRRLRSPRAGLLGGLALVTLPLFLFESRQLTSDAGALAGSALSLYGIVGLAWPCQRPAARAPLHLALDGAAVAVGLLLAFLGWGLVHAVLTPALAVALAATIGATQRGDEPGADDRRRLLTVAAVTGAVALAVVAVLLDGWNDKGYQKLLGGAFRPGPPPATATYDYLINQLAFGLFPWTGLAPIAVVRLALFKRFDRAAWGGVLLCAWAAFAYVLASLWVREIGELRYPALVPIGLALGFLVDDLLGDDARGVAARALPLLALLAVCAGVQVARDIGEFPEELASVHLLGKIAFPKVVHVGKLVIAVGVVFLAAAAVAVGAPPRLRGFELRRPAVPTMVGLSLLCALVLSWAYTPVLSQHFSYKNVFDAYFAHRKGDEPLGVTGIAGSGPDFYSRGTHETLNGTQGLLAFLQRPDRVFAVAPSTELCSINMSMNAAGRPYHVISSENSRFFLFSNQLGDAKDENPLFRSILRQPPTDIATPISASFAAAEGQAPQIELIGYTMPAQVKKRSTFKMTLYYRVLQRPTSNWKIFVHFDKGVRIIGDHEPTPPRLCGTAFWQPGDYIVDTFEVKAGDLTHPKGEYRVYTGFFTGTNPNWRNMKVTSGNGDNADRVPIGTLLVK